MKSWKRSKPCAGGSGSENRCRGLYGSLVAVVCLSLWAFLSIGCGSKGIRAGTDGSACTVFDSLYRTSGFETPLTIHGKATVDAKQRRLRGKIRVDTGPPGEIVFEFSSGILFGSQREDFLLSLMADTLRVIDRERGAYYEGEDAERWLRESLDTDLGVSQMLILATGGRPSCDELTGLGFKMGRGGEVIFAGRYAGESFRVVFGAGHRRLEEIDWPVLSGTDTVDRLWVTYDWRTDAAGGVDLREVVMKLEVREWRCKIRCSGTG